MQRSETAPLWWDRVDDESGRPLRGDVRESARRVWPSVCAQARRILGDVADAAELLESAIRKISVYLDKNNVPLHAADPGGLLLLATSRAFKRLARHRGQVKSTDQDSALAEVLRAPDWREEVDRRLFVERLLVPENGPTQGDSRGLQVRPEETAPDPFHPAVSVSNCCLPAFVRL